MLPSAHVASPPETHVFCPDVQALVQHAPPLQAPLLHVEVEFAKKQPCASCAQFASVVELEHVAADDLHTASAVHVHAPEPALPVQD